MVRRVCLLIFSAAWPCLATSAWLLCGHQCSEVAQVQRLSGLQPGGVPAGANQATGESEYIVQLLSFLSSGTVCSSVGNPRHA